MDGPTSRSKLRYLADGATIMFGILAALFVDAAWDYRTDRADETEYLASLREEFREAADELASDQRRRAQMREAAATLLAHRTAGTGPERERTYRLVRDLMDYRFYTPSHPVLEEITSAGRITLIRSDRLRFLLRQYAQERERLAVVEQRDIAFVSERLGPYMAARLRLDRYEGDDGVDVEQADAQDLTDLLQLREFGSLVYLRLKNLDTSIRFAGGLDRLISLLLEELGEPAEAS